MTTTKTKNGKESFFSKIFHSREIGIFIVLVVICTLLAIAAPRFLLLSNITNVLRQMAVIAIISVGMTYVIVTGGIDLSVGSTVAFTGCITALMLVEGYPIVLCIIVGLLLGTLVGFVNGLLIVHVNLAPFIATLGTMGIARGLVLALTRGYPIQPFPKSFELIGRGYLWIIPIPVLIMIVIIVVGHLFLSKTRIGRYIYYIGSNEKAARLSGLSVNATLIFVYTIAGFFSGLASIVLISRLTSAQSNMGSGFELDAIAAVVIGGTTLSGGEGSVLGSLIGAALMGIIKNALILLGVNVYWQSVVIGLVIVLAVSIDAFRKNQKRFNLKIIGQTTRRFWQSIFTEKKVRIRLIAILSVIIIIVIAGLTFFNQTPGNQNSQMEDGVIAPTTMPVEIDPERRYEIGQDIIVCDNLLVVNSVTVEEGEKSDLIIVNLEITNNSDKQVPINSFDFTAVDINGKTHTDTAIGRTESPLGNERLDPGLQVSGEVAFQAVEEEQPLILIWQPGWCTGVAYVDL